MLGEKSFAVKIYTSALEYDYQTPWKAPTIEKWTGSGFVIDGKRIITNAHVAGGAIFLEVQLANDSVKYHAKLRALSHDCDLAELEVDNEEFWEKTSSLPIGTTPSRKQKVEVHGFPRGGEGYCITDGIVSRLENDMYAHGEQILLSTQVSAPINPGNSGGAAISEGKVVGVVHQGINGSQSIGYMIPASVLSHFIRQVESNNIGFPTLGIDTQNLENPYLREQCKMREHDTGILVRSIPGLSCVKGKLQEGDVLMKINDIQVWNDGTVHVEPMKRIDYKYLINNSKMGDKVTFEVLRDGKICVEKVVLTNSLGSTHIIGPREFGEQPTYYVIGGGIVVQPVTKNYMSDTNKSYSNKTKENASDQLVIVNCILQSEYTQGYDGFHGALIAKVNGKEIHNIQEVIDAIQSNHNRLHTLEMQSGKIIAIPKLPKPARDEILKAYHITSDRSNNLKQTPVKTDEVAKLFHNFRPAMLYPDGDDPTVIKPAYLPRFASSTEKLAQHVVKEKHQRKSQLTMH